MLSYQHGFHAGSFADVHKHTALCLLIDHFLKKPAAFCFIDSHAGGGPYDAGQVGPVGQGLARYLDLVLDFNEAGGLKRYPGSPSIAASLMRQKDRLIFIEAHPAEHLALRAAFWGDARVHIHKRDAFESLPALTPPPERRGLVLIDPSYEVKSDYLTVPKIVGTALRRWPAGIFAIWYPLLPDDRHLPLVEQLEALACPVLVAELTGPKPERGLVGTGLAVINPPWQFGGKLAEVGDEIAVCLFGDAGRHSIRASGVEA